MSERWQHFIPQQVSCCVCGLGVCRATCSQSPVTALCRSPWGRSGAAKDRNRCTQAFPVSCRSDGLCSDPTSFLPSSHALTSGSASMTEIVSPGKLDSHETKSTKASSASNVDCRNSFPGETGQATVSRLLVHTLPSVELQIFEGLGHIGPVTHPAQVDEAIEAFLVRHPPVRPLRGLTFGRPPGCACRHPRADKCGSANEL